MGAVSAGVETVSVCLLFVYFVRKDGLIGRSMLASVSGGTCEQSMASRSVST